MSLEDGIGEHWILLINAALINGRFPPPSGADRSERRPTTTVLGLLAFYSRRPEIETRPRICRCSWRMLRDTAIPRSSRYGVSDLTFPTYTRLCAKSDAHVYYKRYHWEYTWRAACWPAIFCASDAAFASCAAFCAMLLAFSSAGFFMLFGGQTAFSAWRVPLWACLCTYGSITSQWPDRNGIVSL